MIDFESIHQFKGTDMVPLQIQSCDGTRCVISIGKERMSCEVNGVTGSDLPCIYT
jgi:hypothetical protein